MRLRDAVWSLVVTVASVGTVVLVAGRADVRAEQVPLRPELPFNGPGQVLTVWSWGIAAPRSPWALAITTADGTREVTLPASGDETLKPTLARWRNRREAVVDAQVLRPAGPLSTRILRLELDPLRSVTLVDDCCGLLDVSPDGRVVTLERVGHHGSEGFAVWSLDPPLELAVGGGRRGESGEDAWSGYAVWDPTSTRMAAGIFTGTDRLLPRLALVSGDLRQRTWLPEAPDGGSMHRGTRPLFWSGSDLYAASRRGLLRCGIEKGCVSIYYPGDGRMVRGAARVGPNRALVLVSDQREDFLETRAKEVYDVDLRTGSARLLLRLPDDAFLSDIDWIE